MRAHRPSGDTGGVPGPEGIPVRLIAGVLVCVMAAACGAAGIFSLWGRLNHGGSGPEELPFAQANGLCITELQAWEGLPAAVSGAPEISVSGAVTRPGVSVSGPDGEGCVTYTVTYRVSACLPADGGESSLLVRDYELWDFYTGQRYLPSGQELISAGEARLEGSASIQWGEASCPLSWQRICRGASPRQTWEDGAAVPAMDVTLSVRAPAGYDGLLLGINVTDPPAPGVDPTAADLPHYRFSALGPEEPSPQRAGLLP